LISAHAAPFVDALGGAKSEILKGLCPREIAISANHSVRSAVLEGLFGVQGGMDPAEYHAGAALSRHATNGVAAQSIAGMNADADDVAWFDAGGVPMFEGFIANYGVAKGGWRSRRQNVKPAGSDNGSSKGRVARVDQMYPHGADIPVLQRRL
jgi:hypothetical protein